MITLTWVDIVRKSIKSKLGLFNVYELIGVVNYKKFLIKVNYVDLFKNKSKLLKLHL